MKLIIPIGLPASGKTTFLKQYKKDIISKQKCRYKKPSITYIDFDTEKELRKNWLDYDIVIIDGLFLTNDDIIKLIQTISEITAYVPDEIDIHYWIPNIEYCLWNDKCRRDKDSTITIKNSIVEKIDKDYIVNKYNELHLLTDTYYKQTFEIKIEIFNHDVIEKPMSQMFIDKYDIYERDGYLYSEKWSTGGSRNNCWGDSWSIEGEEPKEFYQLDNLLTEISPNISFLQYKRLLSKCVEVDNDSVNDYYGGCEYYNFYKCDLEKLYEELTNMNLIND